MVNHPDYSTKSYSKLVRSGSPTYFPVCLQTPHDMFAGSPRPSLHYFRDLVALYQVSSHQFVTLFAGCLQAPRQLSGSPRLFSGVLAGPHNSLAYFVTSSATFGHVFSNSTSSLGSVRRYTRVCDRLHEFPLVFSVIMFEFLEHFTPRHMSLRGCSHTWS